MTRKVLYPRDISDFSRSLREQRQRFWQRLLILVCLVTLADISRVIFQYIKQEYILLFTLHFFLTKLSVKIGHSVFIIKPFSEFII